MQVKRSLISLLVAAGALAGCAVGPDYPGVDAQQPDSKTFVRQPEGVTNASPSTSNWWLALNDDVLNGLITVALKNNYDLQAAQARLRQARSQLRQQEAAQLPTSSALSAAARTNMPGSGEEGGGPVTLYTTSFDASWEIDIFGGTRRAVEAASAQAEAVEADLADTQLSLVAEIAKTYVDLRRLQQQLALQNVSADVQQRMLTLTQQRRAAGVASEVDVERLTTQVASTRASITPLQAQVVDAKDRLAVLTGAEPGSLDAKLGASVDIPDLPAQLTVTDPATMLRQRPDIRAAERRLASAYARIGENIANYFPKVSLFGSLGFSADEPGHLFRKSSQNWMGIPYLQWNIFDFGRTQSAVAAAEAARDEAQANYSGAVLKALQDANGSLSRYGHQRQHLAQLLDVEASAHRAAVLTEQRYRAGTASLIDLLDTQRADYTAQQNAVAGKAELVGDFIALHKSLGLGWQTDAASQTPVQEQAE